MLSSDSILAYVLFLPYSPACREPPTRYQDGSASDAVTSGSPGYLASLSGVRTAKAHTGTGNVSEPEDEPQSGSYTALTEPLMTQDGSNLFNARTLSKMSAEIKPASEQCRPRRSGLACWKLGHFTRSGRTTSGSESSSSTGSLDIR